MNPEGRSFGCVVSVHLPSYLPDHAQIPYPLIALVTRMPHTLLGKCPITIRSRTFEMVTLAFTAEQDAADVFDSIKDLTVASTS